MSNSNQYSCFLLLFLSLMLGNSAHAQTETADPYHDLSTKQLYTEGTNLLTHGHSFEKVIAIFSELSRREPKNGEYKVILGCACASRAFIVSRAYAYSTSYAKQIPYYERKMARWRAAQEDKTSPAYGVPEPEKPSPPMIADDNQRFKLTAEEAKSRIKELSLAAQAHLKEGVELCANEPPATRARLLNLQGWALLLLWNEPRRSTPEAWGKKDGAAEVVAALEAAAALQPENLTYLRSLGDGCVIAARDEYHPLDHPRRTDPVLMAKGILTLRKVLERTPNDGVMWLRVSQLESPQRSSANSKKGIVEALQHSLRTNPANALLWYDLAAMFTAPEDTEKLLTTLEQGNLAPSLAIVHFVYDHPKLMAWAFSQQTCSRSNIQVMLDVVPVFTQLAQDAANNRDEARLLRLASITLNMAKKYRKYIDLGKLSTDEIGDLDGACDFAAGLSDEDLTLFQKTFRDTPEVSALLHEAKALKEKYDLASSVYRVLEDDLIRR